jgi:hypothetical protein
VEVFRKLCELKKKWHWLVSTFLTSGCCSEELLLPGVRCDSPSDSHCLSLLVADIVYSNDLLPSHVVLNAD